MKKNKELKRSLETRHIQMIALGGTIGVGLFMGSASTIKWTGPSVMLAYAIVGIFIFFIMRAMGEMQYVEPSTGSFATFGHKYIHPLAGYTTAWSNWFQWVVVGMAEIIAVGTYMKYWFPDLPAWIPGIIAMVILGAANLFSVKSFGEFEFWFSLIKIVTIVLMIVSGIGLIFFGIGNGGNAIGLSNLWQHGGFFTGGWSGFFFALSLVIGAYQGVELIGITAGEAKKTRKKNVNECNSKYYLAYFDLLYWRDFCNRNRLSLESIACDRQPVRCNVCETRYYCSGGAHQLCRHHVCHVWLQ